MGYRTWMYMEGGRERQRTLPMMPREIPPSVIAGLVPLGQPGVMGRGFIGGSPSWP